MIFQSSNVIKLLFLVIAGAISAKMSSSESSSLIISFLSDFIGRDRDELEEGSGLGRAAPAPSLDSPCLKIARASKASVGGYLFP